MQITKLNITKIIIWLYVSKGCRTNKNNPRKCLLYTTMYFITKSFNTNIQRTRENTFAYIGKARKVLKLETLISLTSETFDSIIVFCLTVTYCFMGICLNIYFLFILINLPRMFLISLK